MKLKVNEEGVLIPKALLGDSQEVEIIQQEETIILKIKKQSTNYKLQSNLESRKPGYWKGKVKIADDFDILPDNIQNSFMGLSE
ncbi:hypothetical protein [Crocosphaera chwakensis]|uniref:Uncharacterized protein n=1 Tax=Crocosphaera chwakensis CCY0110 TaxID=391612 RepID=A3ITT2_9CHRO|nr:hypothetical protein [Crocosphaera chwakensis]EAZ90148.1 hypothetical protein CY0110_06094 [Crocosphaera chwakensis CCY0110]